MHSNSFHIVCVVLGSTTQFEIKKKKKFKLYFYNSQTKISRMSINKNVEILFHPFSYEKKAVLNISSSNVSFSRQISYESFLQSFLYLNFRPLFHSNSIVVFIRFKLCSVIFLWSDTSKWQTLWYYNYIMINKIGENENIHNWNWKKNNCTHDVSQFLESFCCCFILIWPFPLQQLYFCCWQNCICDHECVENSSRIIKFNCVYVYVSNIVWQ